MRCGRSVVGCPASLTPVRPRRSRSTSAGTRSASSRLSTFSWLGCLIAEHGADGNAIEIVAEAHGPDPRTGEVHLMLPDRA